MSQNSRIQLQPLQQHIQVLPGHVVPHQQALIIKETDKYWTRMHLRIHAMDEKGKCAMRIGSIDENKRKVLSRERRSWTVQDANKQEWYSITKTKGVQRGLSRFTATLPDETVLWTMDVHRHWTKAATYALWIHPNTPSEPCLILQKQYKGDQMAITWNGQLVALVGEKHMHLYREDEVHIAAGMDRSLAIGVAFVHYVKQKMDDEDEDEITDGFGNVGSLFGSI